MYICAGSIPLHILRRLAIFPGRAPLRGRDPHDVRLRVYPSRRHHLLIGSTRSLFMFEVRPGVRVVADPTHIYHILTRHIYQRVGAAVMQTSPRSHPSGPSHRPVGRAGEERERKGKYGEMEGEKGERREKELSRSHLCIYAGGLPKRSRLRTGYTRSPPRPFIRSSIADFCSTCRYRRCIDICTFI